MAACGWQVAERQRDNEGRNREAERQRGVREESARARNMVGLPGARVLTSPRCIHVGEVSSHVEPACPQGAERGEPLRVAV